MIMRSKLTDVTAKDLRDISSNHLTIYDRIISIEEYIKDLESVTMNNIEELVELLDQSKRFTVTVEP